MTDAFHKFWDILKTKQYVNFSKDNQKIMGMGLGVWLGLKLQLSIICAFN